MDSRAEIQERSHVWETHTTGGVTHSTLAQTYRFNDACAQSARYLVSGTGAMPDKAIRGNPKAWEGECAIHVVPRRMTPEGVATFGNDDGGVEATPAIRAVLAEVARQRAPANGQKLEVMVLARRRTGVRAIEGGVQSRMKEILERWERSPAQAPRKALIGPSERLDAAKRQAVREQGLGVRHQVLGNDAQRLGIALDLETRTIHQAKGREADIIVLIDEGQRYRGRRERAREGALAPVRPPGMDREGEERRLWYVALTRAKRESYVILPGADADPSPYVHDLLEGPSDRVQIAIEGIEGMTEAARIAPRCPRCGDSAHGGRLMPTAGGRALCADSYGKGCGHAERACPRCGTAPVRRKGTGQGVCADPKCGAQVRLCRCEPPVPLIAWEGGMRCAQGAQGCGVKVRAERAGQRRR